MKNLLLLLVSLFCFEAMAQQDEGVIVYKQTVNVHKMMGDRAEQFKDMIPEFRSSNMELQFKGSETLYQMAKKQEVTEDDFGGRGGRGFRMRFGGTGGSSKTYRNLEANTSIESTEFMGKQFLIKGEYEDREWKMTGESKMINEMMCLKATTVDSVEARTMAMGRRGRSDSDEEQAENRPPAEKVARNITAWFTPSIPVQAGPANFGNLPGLILELDIDEGNTIYTLASIELKTLDDKIEEPKKGKEVTREEYRVIVREKMKEMREQGGDMGGRQFRVRGGN